ncbi:MAG: hypothetical protein HC944_05065 [Nanoarchaeota archaeon]|nr:hypothetical protein [Nanoarchaeota archaeon]
MSFAPNGQIVQENTNNPVSTRKSTIVDRPDDHKDSIYGKMRWRTWKIWQLEEFTRPLAIILTTRPKVLWRSSPGDRDTVVNNASKRDTARRHTTTHIGLPGIVEPLKEIRTTAAISSWDPHRGAKHERVARNTTVTNNGLLAKKDV